MYSSCGYKILPNCRNPTGEEDRKRNSWKRNKKGCTAIFLFTTILITLNLLKFANPSNQKSKRIKRHLKTTDFANDRNIKIDIEIIPEISKPGNRKIYHHPNHRYEGEFENKKMTNRLRSRKGSQTSEPKRDKNPNNIQDVILKGKFNDVRAKGQSQLLTELLTGSRSTMRLKGVYVHQEGENGLFGSQLSGAYYNSTEINNLMRNDSGVARKRPVKKGFKSPGAPFKLPVNGISGPRRQTPNQRSKTRPITIYLDFFPMTHSDEFTRRKPESNITPSNKFGTPVPSQTVTVGKYLPRHGSRNGIIMKLNLYPKESQRNSDRQTSHSKYNKKAEKKSFGWFSKHETKKNKKKECPALDLNSNGKRLTAKWKNEKGEWIHADHVDVKYLEKENT